MATPNYTPEQISALRSLRNRLHSAKYDWEVRQLLKNTARVTGLKQLQLVQWQDEDNNRKNLLHYLVDERLEKVAIMLIKVFWDRNEQDQRQLMRIIRYPKCYIDSPQGSGEYTVERLAEGRNCEQLVDVISRFRELYPRDVGEEDGEEEDEEERARETERMKRLQRISTPIPRTPSPPDLSSGTTPPLVAANFSPLVVKTPHLAARQASTPPTVPRADTPPLPSTPLYVPSTPPLPQIRTVLPGTSTPPPFIPSTPPAPGAPATPLWYPDSEPEPDPEWEQRAREDQLLPPPPGTPVPVRRSPEPGTPVRLVPVKFSPLWDPWVDVTNPPALNGRPETVDGSPRRMPRTPPQGYIPWHHPGAWDTVTPPW